MYDCVLSHMVLVVLFAAASMISASVQAIFPTSVGPGPHGLEGRTGQLRLVRVLGGDFQLKDEAIHFVDDGRQGYIFENGVLDNLLRVDGRTPSTTSTTKQTPSASWNDAATSSANLTCPVESIIRSLRWARPEKDQPKWGFLSILTSSSSTLSRHPQPAYCQCILEDGVRSRPKLPKRHLKIMWGWSHNVKDVPKAVGMGLSKLPKSKRRSDSM